MQYPDLKALAKKLSILLKSYYKMHKINFEKVNLNY